MFTLRSFLKLGLTQQCVINQKQMSTLKQVKIMKKIMSGRDKGRRQWHYEEFPKMVTAQKLSNAEGQGKEANRRITVLNKLFMKNVTDLMATGIFAEVLYGHGIQITTVKVGPDFKKLNIYWISNQTCDEEVDKKLRSIAGPLRHELSVLRLMGVIPQINFCRDRSLARASQVDSLIKIADFGEDFVPTDPTLFIRTEPKLEYSLSSEIRKRIRELDQQVDEIDDEIPQMRNDIFGLDHDRMMKSVVASMSKTMKAWETYSSGEEQSVEVTKPTDYNRLGEDAKLRGDFLKFLEKRHITPERKKFHRHFNPNEIEDVHEDYRDLPDNDFYDEEK